jgi:hypothetical protein
MRLLSVKTYEFRIDLDGRAQCPRERPLGSRALEADEPSTGVRAAAGRPPVGDERAVASGEPHQLPLGGLPTAADAAPDGTCG